MAANNDSSQPKALNLESGSTSNNGVKKINECKVCVISSTKPNISISIVRKIKLPGQTLLVCLVEGEYRCQFHLNYIACSFCKDFHRAAMIRYCDKGLFAALLCPKDIMRKRCRTCGKWIKNSSDEVTERNTFRFCSGHTLSISTEAKKPSNLEQTDKGHISKTNSLHNLRRNSEVNIPSNEEILRLKRGQHSKDVLQLRKEFLRYQLHCRLIRSRSAPDFPIKLAQLIQSTNRRGKITGRVKVCGRS